MRILLGVWFICTASVAARPNDQQSKAIDRRESLRPESSDVMGIASVAGITSRNGRVSSLTGVKFIPSLDSSIAMSNERAPYFYPLTITKESNGKYASGTIQFYPGSVMVSSTARTGFGPDYKMWPQKVMPLPNDMFFQPPLELFDAHRSIEPWFPKDIYKPIPPPQFNGLDTWIYPNFNPFLNFWR